MTNKEPQMNTDGHGFSYKEETHRIIGCAMEVSNTLGHGLPEKQYENSLCVELGLQEIPFARQPRFNVVCKSVKAGTYVPDLTVFDKIAVDTKTINQITDHEKGQSLNYLKITGLRVGLILNFKYAKLQWQRMIL